jgi:DNA-binding MarR family transcriptional regulator
MNNNLERLIKQNIPFTSPQVKAQVGFLYLAYCYTSSQQAYFKEYGVTLQQYNILRILRGQYPQPANINMLKERMLDKMSDVSRLVDRLQKMDYLTKETNDVDKRNADVLITEKAMQLLSKIDEKGVETATIFNKISEEEVQSFNQIVDKLLGLME